MHYLKYHILKLNYYKIYFKFYFSCLIINYFQYSLKKSFHTDKS